MRLLRVLVLGLMLAIAVPATAEAAPRPRVTVFGDSVQASFGFVPQAVRRLAPGLDVRLEARVCRRLASAGCLGGSPEPVLALARALGPGLGEAAIVNVGYNDFTSRYDVEAVLRALRRAGVRTVVWVTLREAQPRYATMNARIRAAGRRSARRGGPPLVRVADWNAHSAGRPWFTADGLHLNAAGAVALAALLREEVLAGLAEAGVAVGNRLVDARADLIPLGPGVTTIAGDREVLWLARPGRLTGLDAGTGRPLARRAALGPGEDLTTDGRGAWLRDPVSGRVVRPARRAPGLRGRALEGLGPRPLLARAGARLWAVSPCAPGEAGCAEGRRLRGIRLVDGEVQEPGLGPGPVRAAAGDPRALWLLRATPAGAAAHLERRDGQTGALLGRSRLPRAAGAGTLVAAGGGAWVLTANGQLLRVRRDGRTRRVLGRVRAIAGQGRELWALRADRRTVLGLDATGGRARVRAVSPRPLTEGMTLTDQHLWVAAASGGRALRVPAG